MAGDKVLQLSQIGMEVTPGTQVAATHILHAISMGMTREGGQAIAFRPEGYRANVLTKASNREMSTVPVEITPDYRSLTWLYDSLFEAVTPVQQGATVAWKRTYTFDSNAVPAARKTYTLERGDSSLASYATFMSFSGFGITFNREDVVGSASAYAGKRVDAHTLSAGCAEISAIPIKASHGSLKMATTLAGLAGATAETRLVEMEWHFNAAHKARFSANSDVSYSEITNLAPDIGGTLKFWKNSASMAYVASARAGDRKWLKLNFTGPLIASTYYHTLTLTLPVEFIDPGDMADEDDAIAVTLGFTNVHDATAGYSALVELTNDIDGSYAIDT